MRHLGKGWAAIGAQQQPPLAVLQLALKERKQERRWAYFWVVAVPVAITAASEWIGGPWIPWLALTLAATAPFAARAVGKGEEVRHLQWEIAYARGALNQPLEEPKDLSKGWLALFVGLAIAIIAAIGQIVAALIND